jgi:hypothetical protein
MRKSKEINTLWLYKYYMHAHTHIHIQNWAISNACGVLPPVGEIMGVTLRRGHFQHLKNDLNKKITWSYMISTNVLGRKTYYNLYANDQVQANPPESMPEAITWIEIIFSKPKMHIDTGIIIQTFTGPIQWILNIFSSKNLLHFLHGIPTLGNTQNYWLLENIPDMHFFGKSI